MDKIRISTKKKVLTIEMTEKQADHCFDKLCQGLLGALLEDALRSAPVDYAAIFNDPVGGRPAGRDNTDQSGGGKCETGKA